MRIPTLPSVLPLEKFKITSIQPENLGIFPAALRENHIKGMAENEFMQVLCFTTWEIYSVEKI